SLIVDIPDESGQSRTPLFVVMKEGVTLTEEIARSIKKQIRTQCSPRHVPTAIHEVKELPKTLNGKKLEVPIKKILMGMDAEKVVNIGSLSNKRALDYFVAFSKANQNG
uniref:AMP-binding enzyme n=1 Tax=Oceanobacillus massiliensis TaxID=1465765 RepID=UPI003AFB2C2D